MTFAHKHDQATASTRDEDWKLSIDYATNNYSILPLNCLLIRLLYVHIQWLTKATSNCERLS